MFKIKHHYVSTYLIFGSCIITAATAQPGIITYAVLVFNMFFLFGALRWARHEGRNEIRKELTSHS